ncbi:MAG: phosphatase PAP2 family protein [Desulfomonile tiedjei]|uniref:Phosphatase PAP2 family protein n=1 Tax=Desulfomonile tiedjei TaxID=2358 RepID=A0A9D6VBV1_9BACT|nr:phosphatase PAP2 family protein [Desulfomonile tiedjei]
MKEVPPRTPPQELLAFAGIHISQREIWIPASVGVSWKGSGGTFFAKEGSPNLIDLKANWYDDEHSRGFFFAAGAFLLMGLALGPVMWFNHPLFIIINGLHTPETDMLWLAFTTLGDGFLLVIFLGAFLLVNPRVALFGIMLLLLSSLLIHIIKICFPVFRPVVVLDTVHVVGPILRSGSFPSGHSAAAMSAGLTLAKFSSTRGASAGAILIAVLIGVSRIFVGAHFPADVLGGMMCATLMFITLDRFIWPGIRERVPAKPLFSSPAFRRVFYLEVFASLYAVSLYSYHSSELPWVGAFAAFMVLVFLAVGYVKSSSGPC